MLVVLFSDGVACWRRHLTGLCWCSDSADPFVITVHGVNLPEALHAAEMRGQASQHQLSVIRAYA
jgi:hypothetical protein